mmetsp:Transcript_7311/g.14649  ORF Transcript_7311/g.14649 Transcript_7311/m.14649 type:complete len:208 (+) Transcript_7311:432-1055(+)
MLNKSMHLQVFCNCNVSFLLDMFQIVTTHCFSTKDCKIIDHYCVCIIMYNSLCGCRALVSVIVSIPASVIMHISAYNTIGETLSSSSLKYILRHLQQQHMRIIPHSDVLTDHHICPGGHNRDDHHDGHNRGGHSHDDHNRGDHNPFFRNPCMSACRRIPHGDRTHLYQSLCVVHHGHGEVLGQSQTVESLREQRYDVHQSLYRVPWQ